MPSLGDDFQGNQRFRIARRLGSGAAGAVYEAYDRERDETVAVKTLLRARPADIYRFKKEFRALAGVTHPNLAALYELFADEGTWFFTMELIDGTTFLDYVRPPGATGVDHDRLRVALCQLARGLMAVHDAGRLHRDIKPSNVLVDRAGRVVILDFGVSAELVSDGPDNQMRTVEDGIWGTVAYMSPEQFLQQGVTTASDWYSVGTMLYQALTGRLPYTGTNLQVLTSKTMEDAALPTTIVPEVPRDLAELCAALLSRTSVARPTGADVLSRLGAIVAPLGGGAIAATRPADGPLLGRETHLRSLYDAFDAVRDGTPVSVYLHGASGVGKSRLIHQFTEAVARRDGAVVLSGKCYVRESVPNKALDDVIDSLSRYLRTFDRAEAIRLVPSDVTALMRVFPVLARVDAFADAPYPDVVPTDPRELRRRAMVALRALLTMIATRRPLVLHVDDLQWADAASAELLGELLAPPHAPPLLLISSFRTEDLRSQPFLHAALARVDGTYRRELRVERLSHADSLALARRLLRPAVSGIAGRVLEQIAWESAGVPFLIEQLARYIRDGGAAASVSGASLSEMLEASIGQQPAGARTFLETLVVAGSPLDTDVACEAAGVSGHERALVAALTAAQLVRASGAAGHVELYHDRIRETLALRLDRSAVRAIHAQLARTFERRQIDDPDALFEHYAGADDAEQAAMHAARAAGRAAAALAFPRAAFFFRQALARLPATAPERASWTAGLAEALANDGRPAEAARMFLEAADASDALPALDYRRRAAEQLLMGGHTDEGLAVIETLLRTVGLTLPTSPWRVLVSFLLRRMQLRLRGLGVGERTAARVTAGDLLRIDICWTGAAGLGLTEIIRAALFQTVHMLLALRAGEPLRVARALALDAGFAATPGEPARARAAIKIARAREAAARVDHPYAIGLATLTSGIAAYLVGEWRTAVTASADAERILQDHATGIMWEVTSAQSYRLGALTYLGEVFDVTQRVPALLADAQERGNLYAATEVRTRQNIVWLVSDEPERAYREVHEALARWSRINYYRQHYNALRALMQIDLYVGAGDTAWERMAKQWPALKRSLMLRVQVLRIEAWSLRARAALQVAARLPDPTAPLAACEALTAKIAREGAAWSAPFVPLARSAMADQRGDRARAVALLASAIAGFDGAGMALHAAAARRRLGQLTGGPGVHDADTWMASQRIRDPVRMTRMLAPGFVLGPDD